MIRFAPVAVGAAALSLGLGTPAHAQNKIVLPRAESRHAGAVYGACMVKQIGPTLRRLLAKPYGSREVFADYQRFADGICAPEPSREPALQEALSQLRFSALTFRAILYDAFYRTDFAAGPAVADFSAVPALVYPVADDADEAAARGYLTMISLGDCVARQAPAEARVFLLSEAGGADEMPSLRPLVPAFQACIPAGVEFKLSLSMARDALSEPLFRLTEASLHPDASSPAPAQPD